MKNWRLISFSNLDYKIISKAFTAWLKDVLPDLIFLQQTSYVADPPIGESTRLISDFLEISNKSKINRYLVTVDIEKKFNSLDHDFVITAIEKFGFKSSFIDWIKIFLKEQESCVMNGCVATQDFKLRRSASQGDRKSTYLFILSFVYFDKKALNMLQT